MFSRRDFIKGLSTLPILALGQIPLKFLWADERNWISLKELLNGSGASLYLPTDAQYSNLKSLFNLRLKTAPAAILRGASEAAIQKTLNWAIQNNTSIHSRSGGHSYEGFSSGQGIVIDTRPFNKISIDHNLARCRVGAGVQLGTLIQTLFNSGFALPTGSCATVGVAGLCMGGGVGLSARNWGLTCDSLLSAKAILADGRNVNLSETENADLFWAIRGGGGGNYCIVTEFEFALKRALDVYTFAFSWPAREFKRVFQNWEQLIQNGSRQVSSIFKINANSNGISEVKIIGQVLSRDNANAPTANEARSLLQPYLIGNASATRFQKRSFVEAAGYFAGGEDPPVRFKAKSSYAYEELSNNGISAIEDSLSNLPAQSAVSLMMDAYGGAISNKKPSDTAFFHRKALYSVQYYTQWNSDAETSSRLTMMKNLYANINQHFSKYCYANYCDSDLVNPLPLYYGDNLSRLVEIKQKYDPTGLFKNSSQNLV